MQRRKYKVIDEVGLHARHAVDLTSLANNYSCQPEFVFNGLSAPLKSVLGVLSLSVSNGREFELVAEGVDADEFLNAATAKMKANNFAVEIK